MATTAILRKPRRWLRPAKQRFLGHQKREGKDGPRWACWAQKLGKDM